MEDLIMVPTRRTQQTWFPSIFNDFLNYEGLSKLGTTSPAINVIETEKEYKVELAAPGLSKGDFKVRLNEENHLIVSLEKREERVDESKKEKYLRREFSYSQCEQVLLLPDEIKRDHIEAKMENGVLNIIIPKNENHPTLLKEKVIDIK